MDEQEPKKRQIIGINAISLEESDATVPSAEEIAEGDLGFVFILRSLPTDRQKLIALALYQGWNMAEIAQIIQVDHSDVKHIVRRIRIKLAQFKVVHKR